MSLEQAKKAGVSEREYHEIMQEMYNELDHRRMMEELAKEYERRTRIKPSVIHYHDETIDL
jgi:hypothetical protein